MVRPNISSMCQRCALVTLLILALLPRVMHAACGSVPSTYPVVAGTLNLGGSALLNGSNITGAGNTVQTSGVRTNTSPSLPTLSPATFPVFTGVTNQTGGTVAAGTYATVTANNGTVFSGGTYNITTLAASGTVQFAAGTYYVNTMTLANSTVFQVSPAGVVRIYLNNSIAVARSSVKFNTTGAGSGSVNNFQLYLYSSANAKFGDSFAMNGLIYAPDVGSGNRIDVLDNATVSGAWITAGTTSTGGDPHFTTSSAIRTAIGSISTCGTSIVDHYALTHNTTGVNCQAENVTIAAHDSSHTAVSMTNSTTITVTATRTAGAAGTHGDWSLVTGSGTLSNGTADDGVATYTFAAGGESSVVLALKDTWAQTVDANVTDGTYTDTTGTANADAQYNQTIAFRSGGFRFVDGSDANIGNQVAGTTSGTYYLQAINSTGCTTPGACTGVCTNTFANGASVAIQLASECVNPTSCQAGKTVTVTNNSSASAIASNSSGSVSSYTSKSMLFGANGAAAFTMNYPDVGQIKVYAKYDIPLGTGAASGNLMTGSSAAFVVKPSAFTVTNIKRTADKFANPAASSTAGTLFIRAGNAITATITATNSSGVATPNFGKETSPEGVLLTPTRTSGLGLTSNGTLTNGTIAGSSFSAGAATITNLSWDEVGIMTLTPSIADADYLGAGDVSGTTTANIGRFAPDHFDLVSTGSTAPRFSNRSAIASCYPVTTGTISSGSTALTVSSATGLAVGDGIVVWGAGASAAALTTTISALAGVSITLGAAASTTVASSPVRKTGFTYFTEPMSADFRLLARNLGGTTTTNYAGTWASLAPATTSMFGFGAVDTGSNKTSRLSVSSISGAWALGVLDATASLSFSRAASPDGPFDSLDIGIAPSDGDSTILSSYDLNVAGSSDHTKIGRTKLRFGRLRLSNAIGSTLLPLPIPLSTQFYSTYGFVTNTDDSCTTLTGSDFAMSNYKVNLSACETGVSPTSSITFAAGLASLKLTAPGNGNDGSVDLSPNLNTASGNTCASTSMAATASSRTYLQYNWDGGASFDKNPSAKATFGVYRNAGQVIHYQENY